ncbi:MAG: IS110 family transposase [Treponema sp.]|jgi:transposase|nr:IS110 family transposase [Treponema sp.]
MKEYYIGLDVHKDSIYLAVLDDRKIRSNVQLDADLVGGMEVPTNSPQLVKAIKQYQRKGKVFVAYEAGCLGFDVYHFLGKQGIDCQIIPANTVFRPGNEKKIKTDRRDAILIARMLKRGDAQGIYIPSREDEAVRDFIRCRGDLVDDLTRTKQRIQKFLLRHGYRYENNRYWTGKHIKWMKGLEFEKVFEKETFDQYMSHLEDLIYRIERMEVRIETIAGQPEYWENVQKLRAFRGIDYLTALALICEIGDFRRFPSAGAFMSYLGLVPSEFSSGSKRSQGSITKAGNTHIRKLLTESAWHYPRVVKQSKRLAERRVGTSELVIAHADKAMRQLHDKYYKMIHQKKNACVAITAVSRQLAGYIWGVMTMGA